jgi:hypothetical protein
VTYVPQFSDASNHSAQLRAPILRNSMKHRRIARSRTRQSTLRKSQILVRQSKRYIDFGFDSSQDM